MIKNYNGSYRCPYVPIPGWMTATELEWLYQRAREHRTIVEIGSAFGRSSHALLCGNYNSFPGEGRVYCVDPWPSHVKGTKDVFDYGGKDLDRRMQFMQNVGSFPNLNILEIKSRFAASLVPWIRPDMVFIDGGTAQVKLDISVWKNTSCRLLCGHDYSEEYPDVIEAVQSGLKGFELVKDTTIWFRWQE